MRQLATRSGVSLIELITATAIVTVVVVVLSLALPKASGNMAQTRQRAIADQLANEQIQTIKSQPYALVDPSDALATVGTFNAGCDCTTVTDFSVFHPTTTLVANTSFQVAVCIHQVSGGSPSVSSCSTSADTGYKHILVNVAWQRGSQTYSTKQEGIFARL